ncbi:nuclear transport factor 2 family protein [Ekhidna sp.]|uniref:nuclear transport factor 2 family protein n=1 Tax=Ekhidna sp. TaxID=2608089 RepID=UPI003BAD5C9E
MKFIFTLILATSFCFAFSQNTEKEINNMVWKPFTQAWEANDGEAFNKIHSKDVWRINPGRLLIGEEYKSRNSMRMNGVKKDRIIEFTFETRTSNGDNAYEVGYYRITDTSGLEPKFYVGRFHVALKKIDGQWKIIQDWDTDKINDVEITPESISSRNFTHFN